MSYSAVFTRLISSGNGFGPTETLLVTFLSNVLFILAVFIAVFTTFCCKRVVSCYAPAHFTSDMNQYAQRYCENSKYLRLVNSEFSAEDAESHQKFNNSADEYYSDSTQLESYHLIQLLLWHAVLLRLPQVIWFVSKKFAGVNVDSLLHDANKCCTDGNCRRRCVVRSTAEYLHINYSLHEFAWASLSRKTLSILLQLIPGGIVLCIGCIITSLLYATAVESSFWQLMSFTNLNSTELPLKDIWKMIADTDKLFGNSSTTKMVKCALKVSSRDRMADNGGDKMDVYNVDCLIDQRYSESVQLVVPYLLLIYTVCRVAAWWWFAVDSAMVVFGCLLPGARQWFLERHIGLSCQFSEPGRSDRRRRSLRKKPTFSKVSEFANRHFYADGMFILRYLAQRGGDLLVHETVTYTYHNLHNRHDTQMTTGLYGLNALDDGDKPLNAVENVIYQ